MNWIGMNNIGFTAKSVKMPGNSRQGLSRCFCLTLVLLPGTNNQSDVIAIQAISYSFSACPHRPQYLDPGGVTVLQASHTSVWLGTADAPS